MNGLNFGDSSGNKRTQLGWAGASWIGYAIPVIAVAIYVGLGWLNDTTELVPQHTASMDACFWIAGIAGLAACVWSIRITKQETVWRRVRTILPLTLIGFIFVLLPMMRIVEIVNGWIDFPALRTRTYPALLRISRAHATHGKGAGFDIQTTPVWSDMNVTKSDYTFMATHRRPGDDGHSPDEISSKGYFCAKVTIQQSGDAVRVMHAGNETLPADTVVLCPPTGDAPVQEGPKTAIGVR
jgi:hypothetical protein